jgi:hypothetical protein
MATFFVGQRVRLVRPRHPCYQGLEGRIRAMGFWPKGTPTMSTPTIGDCDCVVDWEDQQASLCHTDRLEPIAWSECLWQPEGVAA